MAQQTASTATDLSAGSRAWGLTAGALAGVISVAVFTVLHQVFISAIWWMFPIMAVAGAACGLSLYWCYTELVREPSWRSWWVYNTSFIVMFGLLTLASVIVYEPIITMAEVVESSGGNPIPMSETLALMVPFTLVWAGLLTRLYEAGLRGFGAASVTIAVLMLLLGFNLSTVGLVDVPTEGWILLAEFFGYLTALGVTYGFSYTMLVQLRRSATRS